MLAFYFYKSQFLGGIDIYMNHKNTFNKDY